MDGSPFLCLPGELQNSTFSNAAYMDTQWQNVKDMNINTVLASVTWEQIEPVEGHFTFDELDKNIRSARLHGMRLVLLWFGSFKNGLSTYVPGWVKLDPRRFPRAKIQRGKTLQTIEMLSPFGTNNLEADGRAFRKLMQHIREVDKMDRTVIMVQVENEPGILGASRDYSLLAETAYQRPVSARLLENIKARKPLHTELLARRYPFQHIDVLSSLTWLQAFGVGAPEAFMANAFSLYLQHVAAEGKSEYPLPFFVNAWLNCDSAEILDLDGIPLKHNMTTVAGDGAVPDDYPSGGGCPHVLDIWKVNAPSLDFIAPDVYLHDMQWVAQQYTQLGQGLFIPEQRRDDYGARRLMYNYGTHAALGCSPFGIDTLDATDPLACPFRRVFGLLSKMKKQIMEARLKGPHAIMGLYFDESERSHPVEEWTRTFGKFTVRVERAFVFGKAWTRLWCHHPSG